MRRVPLIFSVLFAVSLLLLPSAANPSGCCRWKLQYYINIAPQSVQGNGDDTTMVAASATGNSATGLEDVEAAPESDLKVREQTATGQYDWSATQCTGWSYKWKTSTEGCMTGGNTAHAEPMGHAKAFTHHDLKYTLDLTVNATDEATSEATVYEGSPPVPKLPQNDADTINQTIQDVREQAGIHAKVQTSSHVSASWKAEYTIDTVATNQALANAPLKFEGWCKAPGRETYDHYVVVTVNNEPPEELPEGGTQGCGEYDPEESTDPLWPIE